MTTPRHLAGLLALLPICASPALGFDLNSSTIPGRLPGGPGWTQPLTNGEIAINRADKRLIFKNVDGSIGFGSLLNALPAGRKAVELGDASDLTILGRPSKDRAGDQVNFLDYGGKGDGATLNDAAFAAWRAAIVASGKCGYVPSARYLFSGVVDFAIPGAGTRFCVRADDATFITSTTTAPAVQVRASGGTGDAVFFPTITGLRFETNVNGVGVAIGKSDYVDQINSGTFDFVVNNSNTGASAVGLQLNGIFQSDVKAVVNGGSTTAGLAAVQIRQTQFSTLRLAAGHSLIGLHLTGGYSYGNAFLQTDSEEVGQPLVIDSANATKNTFVGGTYIFRGTGVSATAGNNNVMVTPVIGATGAGTGPNVVNSTGLLVLDASASYVTGVLGYTPLKTVDPVATGTMSVNTGGKVLQQQVISDGTAYLTNYTAGKPNIYQVQSGGNHLFNVGGSGRFQIDATTAYFFGLPTSAGTLPSGSLWRDTANGGVLKVVP